MQQIYLWESASKSSAFRGVGRYVSLLKESIPELALLSNLASAATPATIIHPFFNLTGHIAKSYVEKINTRKIAIIHDIVPLKYPKAFPLGLRGRLRTHLNIRLARKLDTIVTDSDASKQDLVKICGIDADKIRVIYPYVSGKLTDTDGPDDTGVLAQYQLKKHGYFIYVGDVNWNKNILNIAKAIKNTSYTLVCVGKAFIEKTKGTPHPWQKEQVAFQELIADDPHFVCTGHIDDKTLAQLYKNAVYNLLISRDEGFGFSYLEAAKLGAPSILADRPIFREISKDQGAIFVDPENVDAITQALNTGVEHELEHKHKSFEAKVRQETFSKERFAEDWRVLLALP
jgi:glycosyltransferase involved in cell wall biosynthesis